MTLCMPLAKMHNKPVCFCVSQAMPPAGSLIPGWVLRTLLRRRLCACLSTASSRPPTAPTRGASYRRCRAQVGAGGRPVADPRRRTRAWLACAPWGGPCPRCMPPHCNCPFGPSSDNVLDLLQHLLNGHLRLCRRCLVPLPSLPSPHPPSFPSPHPPPLPPHTNRSAAAH
jgi:hypothetical protein